MPRAGTAILQPLLLLGLAGLGSLGVVTVLRGAEPWLLFLGPLPVALLYLIPWFGLSAIRPARIAVYLPATLLIIAALLPAALLLTPFLLLAKEVVLALVPGAATIASFLDPFLGNGSLLTPASLAGALAACVVSRFATLTGNGPTRPLHRVGLATAGAFAGLVAGAAFGAALPPDNVSLAPLPTAALLVAGFAPHAILTGRRTSPPAAHLPVLLLLAWLIPAALASLSAPEGPTFGWPLEAFRPAWPEDGPSIAI